MLLSFLFFSYLELIYINILKSYLWEQRKLGNLFTKDTERNKKDAFNYSQTLSVSTMTFNKNGNGAAYKSLKNYKVLRVGDVAFEGHTNKTFSYGRFVVNSKADGIMSPRFAALRPRHKLNINYWKNYLHNENVMRYVLVKSTKAGTMMNELVYSDLYKQKINVPGDYEQEKIGALLGKLDFAIDLQQKKLEQLKLLSNFFVQKLFSIESTPNLRFKGFTNSWEKRRLKDLGKILTGNTPKTSQPENYNNNGIPWITPSDIKGSYTTNSEKHLSEKGKTNARVVPAQSILVTCIASIGKNTLVLQESGFNQQINSLIPVNTDPAFLLAESQEWSAKMVNLAGQTSLPIINKKTFSDILTSVPNLEEQQKLGCLCTKLNKIIIFQGNKLKELKSLKKFLLQKLFI